MCPMPAAVAPAPVSVAIHDDDPQPASSAFVGTGGADNARTDDRDIIGLFIREYPCTEDREDRV